jgi:hypothetical protein
LLLKRLLLLELLLLHLHRMLLLLLTLKLLLLLILLLLALVLILLLLLHLRLLLRVGIRLLLLLLLRGRVHGTGAGGRELRVLVEARVSGCAWRRVDRGVALWHGLAGDWAAVDVEGLVPLHLHLLLDGGRRGPTRLLSHVGLLLGILLLGHGLGGG